MLVTGFLKSAGEDLLQSTWQPPVLPQADQAGLLGTLSKYFEAVSSQLLQSHTELRDKEREIHHLTVPPLSE